MVTEVFPDLFVGDEELCAHAGGKSRGATLHACKAPCHRIAVGYSTREKLAEDHPEYLRAVRDQDLYLNLIDPPVPLFKVESFRLAMEWLDRRASAVDRTYIHCNKGLSRAPSIALLWLARQEIIPLDSYAAATEGFLERFPAYSPGGGIRQFLNDEWKTLTR